MRRIIYGFLSVGLLFSLQFSGYTQDKTVTAKKIIEKSKDVSSIKSQLNYLIPQAEAFFNSGQFQKTIDIAQYILKYLDNNSDGAKSLLEKAKAALANQAKGAVSNVSERLKGAFGSFGK